MKIKNIWLYILLLVLFVSCDPGTGIEIINNTEDQIFIECETIYDTEFYKVEMFEGTLHRYIRKDTGGYFTILSGHKELKQKELFYILIMVGVDMLSELRLGTINSIDDVVSAIDKIFIELNVYIYDNSEKKLLHNKDYFLDKQNINIKSRFILFKLEGAQDWLISDAEVYKMDKKRRTP